MWSHTVTKPGLNLGLLLPQPLGVLGISGVHHRGELPHCFSWLCSTPRHAQTVFCGCICVSWTDTWAVSCFSCWLGLGIQAPLPASWGSLGPQWGGAGGSSLPRLHRVPGFHSCWGHGGRAPVGCIGGLQAGQCKVGSPRVPQFEQFSARVRGGGSPCHVGRDWLWSLWILQGLRPPPTPFRPRDQPLTGRREGWPSGLGGHRTAGGRWGQLCGDSCGFRSILGLAGAQHEFLSAGRASRKAVAMNSDGPGQAGPGTPNPVSVSVPGLLGPPRSSRSRRAGL